MRSQGSWLFMTVLAAVTVACGGNGGKSTPPPACGQSCQDGVALRAVRTMLKLAYNFTVQGKPVGAQDWTIPCVFSLGTMGSVHVHGVATSNTMQGATFVGDITTTPPTPLTYDFSGCRWIQTDPTSDQNFDIVLTGTVDELGTIAQQPTATTTLAIASTGLHLSGTVYDPASAYDEVWNVVAAQDGNNVGACICTPVSDAGDAGSASNADNLQCGVDAGVDCRTAAFSFSNN